MRRSPTALYNYTPEKRSREISQILDLCSIKEVVAFFAFHTMLD